MDVASVPHSVQVDTGKIGVKKMTIERKKTAAPTIPEEKARQQTQEVKTEQPSEEKIKQEAATKLATERAAAKETVEKALALLGGKRENARMVLRLLSGGEATLIALSGQMEIELQATNKIQAPGEKQAKIIEIQSKYQKLFKYAESRQEETKKSIDKLKKSTIPEDQALAFDLEIARVQTDIISFKHSVENLDLALKNNFNPKTGEPLKEDEKNQYQKARETFVEEINKLEKKILGEPEKEGLKAQREKIKAKDGGEIPNIIEATAVALSGGEVDAIQKAQENPIEYIEEVVAKAVSSKEGMSQLEESLKKINLITDEKDLVKFKKDMMLGLSADDKIKMAKETGKTTVMSALSLIGLIGYVAWKRTQEGGGQQMMG
jgi:hypothetical protein